jgi:diguanylate cyclase (GGDEF)-like protein
MSCHEELRELEEQGIDLVELLGQDRHLGSPEDLQEVVSRLSHCFEDLHSELLYFLTCRRFPAEKARTLWNAIVKHKRRMAASLGRPVAFRVAALDYLSSRDVVLRGVRLIAKPEFESFLSFVNVDEVSAVYNRRYFHQVLKDEFHRARRYGAPLSLLILDIDGFKGINDTCGHMEGDIVLRKLGRLLKDSTRQADAVCRYGGDEFALVLPQTSGDDARIMAERIRKATSALRIKETSEPSSVLWAEAFQEKAGAPGVVGRPDGAGQRKDDLVVTVSIGGATYPSECDEVEELIALADQNCLAAKRAGKNRVHMASGEGDWSIAAD